MDRVHEGVHGLGTHAEVVHGPGVTLYTSVTKFTAANKFAKTFTKHSGQLINRLSNFIF